MLTLMPMVMEEINEVTLPLFFWMMRIFGVWILKVGWSCTHHVTHRQNGLLLELVLIYFIIFEIVANQQNISSSNTKNIIHNIYIHHKFEKWSNVTVYSILLPWQWIIQPYCEWIMHASPFIITKNHSITLLLFFLGCCFLSIYLWYIVIPGI